MNEFLNSRLGLLTFLLAGVLLYKLFALWDTYQVIAKAKEEAAKHNEATGENKHWTEFLRTNTWYL